MPLTIQSTNVSILQQASAKHQRLTVSGFQMPAANQIVYKIGALPGCPRSGTDKTILHLNVHCNSSLTSSKAPGQSLPALDSPSGVLHAIIADPGLSKMLPVRTRPAPSSRRAKAEEPCERPRAVLDARMYPHIVDMIVTSAPHDSLVRLRAVCRMLRDQCDGLLARHLIMAPRHILPRASPVDNEPHAFSAVDVGVEEEDEEEWDEFADPPEAVLPPVTPPTPDTREFKVSITSPYGRIPLFRAWQQALWKDTGAEVDDQSLSCE